MFCAGPRMPNPLRPCASLPCGVLRKPPPAPNLPPPPAFSSASLTLSARPPKSLPSSSSMAAFASSSLSRSTKANPRERPVSLSLIIFTERTVRFAPAIKSFTCPSVVSKGRFPTNRRAMEAVLSFGAWMLVQNEAMRIAGRAVASCRRDDDDERSRAPAGRDQALRRLHGAGSRRSRRLPRRGVRPLGAQRRRQDHAHQPGSRHRARQRRYGGSARPRRGARLPLHPPRGGPRASRDQLRSLLHRRGNAPLPGGLLRRATH